MEDSAAAPARTIPIDTTTAETLIDTASATIATTCARTNARWRSRRCGGATKPIWLNPADGIAPSFPSQNVRFCDEHRRLPNLIPALHRQRMRQISDGV